MLYMFEILSKYRHNCQFEFRPFNSLTEVCNVPINKSGVYLILDVADPSSRELIYIGSQVKWLMERLCKVKLVL